MWEAQLMQAKEFAAHPKSSNFQRQLLRTDVAELEYVVNNLMNTEA